MTQVLRCHFNRAGWLGAISGMLLAFSPTLVEAQIAGDGTLGTQVNNSLTKPCTGFCSITNGATRGSNLFHSFRQFSLPNGDIADFQIAPAIQNVIVRVTGVGQPFISNVNGTIQTSNPASFFLLNPNGIIFGPGATLNIGGSFLATTANRMVFQDGTQFNTVDAAPLLTVSVPIGLQFGAVPGNIRMRDARLSASDIDNFSGFVLVGGDVTLDNSIVHAPGSRVMLGGVGGNGAAGLQLAGDRLNFSFATGTPRQDITLTNGSLVSALASNGGGEVLAIGRNILLESSFISTGISAGINNAATNRAGDITIDASADLQLTQSRIENLVDVDATGQGGNTRITAANIQVRDASSIGAYTFGSGNAGNVQVTANAITIDGTTPDGQFSSGIGSEVFTDTGHGGDVTVKAGTLTITNGATLAAGTYGKGNAGNVQVIANTITLDGYVGGIGSEAVGGGHGGDVSVETDSLTITNGAGISASTFGKGDAGNVRVTANTITLDGIWPIGRDPSAIISEVERRGSGRGGDVIVETNSLTITNGAAISASTFGKGDAGNVQVTANTITLDGVPSNGQFPSAIISGVGEKGSGHGGNVAVKTDSLALTNGAEISTSTYGLGDAGNIKIKSSTIVLDGYTPDSQFPSAIASAVVETGKGRGGDITVETGSLTVSNRATVSASTSGWGNAGSIFVKANTIDASNGGQIQSATVTLSNAGSIVLQVNDRLTLIDPNTGLFASTTGGQGGEIAVTTNQFQISNGASLNTTTTSDNLGGNISVTANSLDASSGGQLRTTTSGNGRAGNIFVNVADNLMLTGQGSGLFAGTEKDSTGNGGSIVIDPRLVLIQDGATIAVNSQGSGTGGNISIQAGRLELRDRGSITAETASAQGGNINLDIKDLLLLRNNSSISATAGTAQGFGNGGNIAIKAPFIVGVARENSDITANAFQGNGGNISINTNAIYGLQYRPQLTPLSDITASSQLGLNGTVAITTLNVDPNRGLVALPINFTDPTQQIAQACSPGSKISASSFVATGRGGIPLSPDEPLESGVVTLKWVPLPEEVGEMVSRGERESGEAGKGRIHPPISSSPIVEAQGWVMNGDGSVELVANGFMSDRANLWAAPVTCQPARN